MNTGDGDVELLSRAILNEAQAESQELQADAGAKAEAIRQAARTEAERERKSLLEQAGKEAERLRSQALATAQLKARSLELEHREKLLDRVFEAAQAGLASAPQQPDYPSLVLELAREGVRRLNSPAAEVRADEATQKILDAAAIESLSKELQTDLHIGKTLERGVGVVVQTPDGRLQFDNTLETRLARLRSTLRPAVYRILMGESK